MPYHIDICICPGSACAIAAANLELRKNGEEPLEQMAGAIIAPVRQLRRASTHHVKAHQDAPWSELADCLAKFSRRASLSTLPANLRGKIYGNKGSQWDWLLQAPPSIAKAYPQQAADDMTGPAIRSSGLNPKAKNI